MRRRTPLLVGAAGLVLVISGVAIYWYANTHWPTRTVYRGSYAPLEPGSTVPVGVAGGDVLWNGDMALGAGLLVLGLLLLAAVGGWALGRRSANRPA